MKKMIFTAVFICIACFATTPIEALKRMEGTVMAGGKCVAYDDATGKACKRKADGTWDCKGTPTIGYGETSKAIVDKGSITPEEAEEDAGDDADDEEEATELRMKRGSFWNVMKEKLRRWVDEV